MELAPLIALIPLSGLILLAFWGFLRRHDPVRVRVEGPRRGRAPRRGRGGADIP